MGKDRFFAKLDPEDGIPNYPIGIAMNTTNSSHQYCCNPSDSLDCAGNLQKALDNCSANLAVYLPAGTFKIGSTLDISSYVVLRGAGSGATTMQQFAKITAINGN